MSRGRRLELGGFGSLSGAGLAVLTSRPALAFVYGIVLIIWGCWLQFREEKVMRRAVAKHNGPPFTESLDDTALPTEGAE
jgi:hypothetical protein